jgi:hypothetical protein
MISRDMGGVACAGKNFNKSQLRLSNAQNHCRIFSSAETAIRSKQAPIPFFRYSNGPKIEMESDALSHSRFVQVRLDRSREFRRALAGVRSFS